MTIDEFLICNNNRKHESTFFIFSLAATMIKESIVQKPKENRFLTTKQISFNDFSLSLSPLHRYFNLFDVHCFLFKRKSLLYDFCDFQTIL
jgi:hypothetical protein